MRQVAKYIDTNTALKGKSWQLACEELRPVDNEPAASHRAGAE
jgi:hypothetical protein